MLSASQMKLTYIFHSGFVLECVRCIMVFDYWHDPSDVLSRFFHAKEQRPIYVFASHFHEDHYNSKILEWRQLYPALQITYILSKDILKRHRAKAEDADVWMVKGMTWQDSNIHVIATGSNDSGVSWIVEVDGRRIFHAGDLCNWYARFLADEANVPETIISLEFGEIHPKAEEKQYLGELKDVSRLCTTLTSLPDHKGRSVLPYFDFAMVPVDGRIGNGYTLGARQFIERFEVGLFVPMHFVASGFESAWRMAPFCEEKDIPFWSIQTEGEERTLD